MSSKPTNILVIGATGVIGQFIIGTLIDSSSSFGKLGILTSASTVQKKTEEIDELKSKGVEVHVGDLTSEADVREAYKHYDTVVSAVGRPIIDKQIELVK